MSLVRWGYRKPSVSFSQSPHSGGSKLPCYDAALWIFPHGEKLKEWSLANSQQEPWAVKQLPKWNPAKNYVVGLEFDPHRGETHDCSLPGIWSQRTQSSCSQILDPQKQRVINVCHWKPPSLGVIYYTAIGNEHSALSSCDIRVVALQIFPSK